MSNQIFVYNSTDADPDKNRVFAVSKPTLLRAAGLTECVPVYMMVGACETCKPEDVLWTPVAYCGVALQLCPDNTQIGILTSGRYALGNPNGGDLVLAGDVNITREQGVDPSLLGKPTCSPDVCTPEAFLGVITNLTLLRQK